MGHAHSFERNKDSSFAYAEVRSFDYEYVIKPSELSRLAHALIKNSHGEITSRNGRRAPNLLTANALQSTLGPHLRDPFRQRRKYGKNTRVHSEIPMPHTLFKSRPDLDAMIDEIGQRLDLLHQASTAASRAEVWTNLTRAVLRLAAPEDHEYVYERLNSVFKAHVLKHSASIP